MNEQMIEDLKKIKDEILSHSITVCANGRPTSTYVVSCSWVEAIIDHYLNSYNLQLLL